MYYLNENKNIDGYTYNINISESVYFMKHKISKREIKYIHKI